jgi:hypothetical protein
MRPNAVEFLDLLISHGKIANTLQLFLYYGKHIQNLVKYMYALPHFVVFFRPFGQLYTTRQKLLHIILACPD